MVTIISKEEIIQEIETEMKHTESTGACLSILGRLNSKNLTQTRI